MITLYIKGQEKTFPSWKKANESHGKTTSLSEINSISFLKGLNIYDLNEDGSLKFINDKQSGKRSPKKSWIESCINEAIKIDTEEIENLRNEMNTKLMADECDTKEKFKKIKEEYSNKINKLENPELSEEIIINHVKKKFNEYMKELEEKKKKEQEEKDKKDKEEKDKQDKQDKQDNKDKKSA